MMSASNKSMGRYVFVFGLLFFLFNLVFLIMGGIYPRIRHARAAAWTEVPCTIKAIEIVEHKEGSRSGGKSTYSIKTEYDYVYNQVPYTGTKFGFGLTDSNRESKEEAIRVYVVGGNAFCYVNPSNPKDSVLNRDFPPGNSSVLWQSGFMVLIGIGLIVVAKTLLRS